MTDHDGVAQRAQQFRAHAVRRIGAVEAQPRNAVGDIEQNRTLVDHRKLSVEKLKPGMKACRALFRC